MHKQTFIKFLGRQLNDSVKMIPAVKPEIKPKPQFPKAVFQSSFESFLTAKDINLSEQSQVKPLPSVENNDSESPAVATKKKRGRKSVPEPENIQDLKNGTHAVETGPNKWSQTCENCPSLVHLMYNHLIEITEGRHHPIQYGTPSSEIIEHLSEALGYNERQIQRMIQMGQKPYRCRYCIESYAIKVELQQHMMDQHKDIKTIPCLECDKMFHSKDNLRAHMQSAHKPKQHKEFPCPVDGCEKEYVNSKMLKRHLDKVHPDISVQMDTSHEYDQEVSPSSLYEPTFNQDEMYSPVPVANNRGRGRGRGRGGSSTRGRGGKRGRPAKQKVVESDTSSDEIPLDREDDEFLVNTETEVSTDDDDIDYVEERF